MRSVEVKEHNCKEMREAGFATEKNAARYYVAIYRPREWAVGSDPVYEIKGITFCPFCGKRVKNEKTRKNPM